jgi:DNA integrity scanning protein DisA with diadenylate cyclase activity
MHFGTWQEGKFIKLHGSINNVGSIVATKEDYEKCYDDLEHNEIGNYLQEILTTKTVLFIGYSFGDDEFTQIYNSIRQNLEEKMPESFVITLNENSLENLKN